MTTINLKGFYYWYTQDQFIEVSDEVAEVFVSDARHEMAYQRRLSRHKAQYSLDCDDGIEYSACLHEPTPQELLERMELFIRLWNALNSLPEIQGRRIDAHIILGKSIRNIKTRTATYKIVGRRNKNIFSSSGKLAELIASIKMKYGDDLKGLSANARDENEKSQAYDLLQYNFTKTVILGNADSTLLTLADFGEALVKTYDTYKEELLKYSRV